MTKWNDDYYDRKWKERMELVECWAIALLVSAAILTAAMLVVGAHKLGQWLLGV